MMLWVGMEQLLESALCAVSQFNYGVAECGYGVTCEKVQMVIGSPIGLHRGLVNK